MPLLSPPQMPEKWDFLSVPETDKTYSMPEE